MHQIDPLRQAVSQLSAPRTALWPVHMVGCCAQLFLLWTWLQTPSLCGLISLPAPSFELRYGDNFVGQRRTKKWCDVVHSRAKEGCDIYIYICFCLLTPRMNFCSSQEKRQKTEGSQVHEWDGACGCLSCGPSIRHSNNLHCFSRTHC